MLSRSGFDEAKIARFRKERRGEDAAQNTHHGCRCVMFPLAPQPGSKPFPWAKKPLS